MSRSGDAAQPRVAGSTLLVGSTACRFCSASSWRNVSLISRVVPDSTRRVVSSVRVVSVARLSIRPASTRLWPMSRSRPPSSGPSAISVAVAVAPALVASPSPSAPPSQTATAAATVPVRTYRRISRCIAAPFR